LQQPIKWGAHLVVHSATKLMDGQGRVLGGVTVGDQFDSENLFIQPIDGPSLSPFNAWVCLKFRDFGHRLDRHCENAESMEF
jgi:O-succinylhomoserine sulfhydrylase